MTMNDYDMNSPSINLSSAKLGNVTFRTSKDPIFLKDRILTCPENCD